MAGYDVVIVGARIAGCALAYQLAARGWRVALVERKPRPLGLTLSVPVSHPRALARFRALDLLPAVEAIAPRLRQMRSCQLPLADDLVIRGHLPAYAGFNYSLVLRREMFDDALLEYVLRQHPEITYLDGYNADGLLREPDGLVAGLRAHTAHGATGSIELRAPLVVGADGRFSQVARLVGARQYNERHPYTTIYYAYCQGFDTSGFADAMFLPSANQRMVLLSELGEGLQVIGVFFPVSQYAAFRRAPLDELKASWRNTPVLADRIEQVSVVGKAMGLAPQSGYFRPAGGPGWALVGDAAHFKDPASGQGLHDALFTVQAFLRALDATTGGAPMTPHAARNIWPRTVAVVQRARDRALLPMYRFTYQFGEALTRVPTRLERALLRTIADDPAATQRFLGILTGATDVSAFNRAAPGYILRGLLAH